MVRYLTVLFLIGIGVAGAQQTPDLTTWIEAGRNAGVTGFRRSPRRFKRGFHV